MQEEEKKGTANESALCIRNGEHMCVCVRVCEDRGSRWLAWPGHRLHFSLLTSVGGSDPKRREDIVCINFQLLNFQFRQCTTRHGTAQPTSHTHTPKKTGYLPLWPFFCWHILSCRENRYGVHGAPAHSHLHIHTHTVNTFADSHFSCFAAASVAAAVFCLVLFSNSDRLVHSGFLLLRTKLHIIITLTLSTSLPRSLSPSTSFSCLFVSLRTHSFLRD